MRGRTGLIHFPFAPRSITTSPATQQLHLIIFPVVSFFFFFAPPQFTRKHAAQLYISPLERCGGVAEPYLAAEQIPDID